MNTALDHCANYLADRPRLTCLLLCALIFVVLKMDLPR